MGLRRVCPRSSPCLCCHVLRLGRDRSHSTTGRHREMRGRHLLLLAAPLGHLLPSRRPRDLAHRLRVERCDTDPRDADHRNGRCRHDEPARGSHEDERLQARREPGPALLAGRLLLEAHHGGHLRVQASEQARSATCPSRRSLPLSRSTALLRSSTPARSRSTTSSALSSAAPTTSPPSTRRRRHSRVTRQGSTARTAREQAPRPGLRRDDDPPGRATRDRDELGDALQEGLRSRADRLKCLGLRARREARLFSRPPPFDPVAGLLGCLSMSRRRRRSRRALRSECRPSD